jgi:hypothetical protein
MNVRKRVTLEQLEEFAKRWPDSAAREIVRIAKRTNAKIFVRIQTKKTRKKHDA